MAHEKIETQLWELFGTSPVGNLSLEVIVCIEAILWEHVHRSVGDQIRSGLVDQLSDE